MPELTALLCPHSTIYFETVSTTSTKGWDDHATFRDCPVQLKFSVLNSIQSCRYQHFWSVLTSKMLCKIFSLALPASNTKSQGYCFVDAVHQGSSFLTHLGAGHNLHLWPSNLPTESISSSGIAQLYLAKRPCTPLWFCISLSHSSQWADVRQLFTFWSFAISRLGRKHCTRPDNLPDTSVCYILLSFDLLLNLEVILDLLQHCFLYLLQYDEAQICWL